MECEICGFLKENKFPICETKHWKVFLHTKDQSYLGRCVVSLKRHCGNLSELNQEESLDFINLVKKLETGLKKAFGATMFNWTCLMNDAYQKKPYDPHVHWHFRPRYDHDVELAGHIFKDTLFGKHYSREENSIVSVDVLKEISNSFRKALKST